MSDSGEPVTWGELEGKLLLVGLTINDHDGGFLRREQCYGRIVSADRSKGLVIALEGSEAGKTYRLPPDLRSVQRAPRGQYRLRSTGEVVTDPDFVAKWIVQRPPPG
jgi:hypothetical protein